MSYGILVENGQIRIFFVEFIIILVEIKIPIDQNLHLRSKNYLKLSIFAARRSKNSNFDQIDPIVIKASSRRVKTIENISSVQRKHAGPEWPE